MPVPVTVLLPADPERLQLGGIASFVRGFVKFAPADFDIAFVGIASGDAPRQTGHWSEVELEGRPLRFLPVVRRSMTSRGRIPLALGFTAALRAHRPQIAAGRPILQFHRPGTALPLLKVPCAKVRVVHLTTSQLRSSGSESRWRLIGPILDRLEARTFAAMDRIYVVNRQAADEYRRRYPPLAARIEFVPNWVDDAIFGPLPEERRVTARRRLRERLGLPDDSPIVLFAGRLERQKDPALLVDAFERVRARGPAALLIVGSGGLLAATRARVERLGIEASVRFVEPVPRKELAELMNASDCLVISSAFETGPTVAYEALATGLPVAGTAVGQLPELIGDGVNGALAPQHSPAALADAVGRVLALPQHEAQRAAADASGSFRASAVLAPVYDAHRDLAR